MIQQLGVQVADIPCEVFTDDEQNSTTQWSYNYFPDAVGHKNLRCSCDMSSPMTIQQPAFQPQCRVIMIRAIVILAKRGINNPLCYHFICSKSHVDKRAAVSYLKELQWIVCSSARCTRGAVSDVRLQATTRIR